ncbi:MAG: class I SAM-dependent methyltransferase [Promethearchaeota archaeon]
MSDEYHFDVKKKRPEESYGNVLDYFKGETLSKYASSKSIMRTQEKITINALEILALKEKNALILDAGCGPGFAAMYLKEIGYKVVSIDIVSEFLSFYDIRELNPLNADMCFPPFRENSFDAILSISSLQWIFREVNNTIMRKNIITLFKAFFSILKPWCKLVFQFYPKNSELTREMGVLIADNTEFKGNFIINNPENPKKRKIFLELVKEK